MKTITKARPADIDAAAIQTVVNRRLALRLGLTLPVAALVAALNGVGPQEARS